MWTEPGNPSDGGARGEPPGGETRKGITTTYTYEERAAYWKRMPFILLGASLLSVGGAVWYGIQWRRERQFA